MRGLTVDDKLAKVLVLGAHSDDIEIGLGGTLLRLARTRPDLHVDWVVLAAAGARREEATASAAHFLEGFKSSSVQLHQFRDSYFPYDGAQIKDCFEALKKTGDPGLIFTHRYEDAHQDHRIVAEFTRNTFRDHLVLEYEVPKYDGDMGQPNVYVPLTTDELEAKVQALLRFFGSQRARSWFDADTFRGLARLRGVECNAPSGFAEAFYSRKAVLEL